MGREALEREVNANDVIGKGMKKHFFFFFFPLILPLVSLHLPRFFSGTTKQNYGILSTFSNGKEVGYVGRTSDEKVTRESDEPESTRMTTWCGFPGSKMATTTPFKSRNLTQKSPIIPISFLPKKQQHKEDFKGLPNRGREGSVPYMGREWAGQPWCR